MGIHALNWQDHKRSTNPLLCSVIGKHGTHLLRRHQSVVWSHMPSPVAHDSSHAQFVTITRMQVVCSRAPTLVGWKKLQRRKTHHSRARADMEDVFAQHIYSLLRWLCVCAETESYCNSSIFVGRERIWDDRTIALGFGRIDLLGIKPTKRDDPVCQLRSISSSDND
jgi:hypothetical protein